MKRITHICALLNLGFCATACQHELSTCDSSNDPALVEVFTWWQTDAETAAAQAVIDVYKVNRPNSTVLHSRMGNRLLFLDLLDRRMSKKRTPDTFQTNTGTSLLSWVGDSPRIERLDTIWPKRNWSVEFDRAVVDAASQTGVPYCIPIDIHRINTLFYNARLLADRKIDPSSLGTLDGFRQACTQLKGVGIKPIALGIQDSSWTLAQLVHENLLPAIAGPEYYTSLWKGQANPATDAVIKPVYAEIVSWLTNGWINDDFETIPSSQAEARILDNSTSSRAAFFIMGDWASGDLKNMASARGLDESAFDRLPFPTSSPFFVYTADCFPLPLGAPHRAAAIELLDTFASVDGQLAFSQKKGSIPARQVDVSAAQGKLDAAQIATMSHFNQSQTTKLLAVSGMSPSGAVPQLNNKLVEMLKARDPQVVLDYWKVSYGLLQ